ncbi:MAG TPA: F0F1 ATP synthase subunit B [Acidimicrobiales bacterium]|nr:F0F1 ATP synthase subunit B [Acidimicrobiales bacterium]
MRTRALFASVLLALGGLLALAPAAYAQENGDEPQLSEDTEECIHLAEEADDPKACQEAPSPILPAADEFIWGSIAFLVLLFLLWKFAYPSIKQGMEARTERIRADLASAEDAKTEAQTVLDEYRAQLADAKAEAGRIIEEARAAADAVKRDHEARLQTELAEIRARAVSDIDSAKAQAMADLRGEVAQLAIGAAETVVGRNLDEATQVQLVEDYINQVAAQRA